MALSTPTPSSPVCFPCEFESGEFTGYTSEIDSVPPSGSPRVPKCIELMAPETMVLLVNALWLATRKMMRNGAMTCGDHLD